jgi:hypothetical protein
MTGRSSLTVHTGQINLRLVARVEVGLELLYKLPHVCSGKKRTDSVGFSSIVNKLRATSDSVKGFGRLLSPRKPEKHLTLINYPEERGGTKPSVMVSATLRTLISQLSPSAVTPIVTPGPGHIV